MHAKKNFRSAGFLIGTAFVLALFLLGFAPNIASAACPDDDEFTSEFRVQDCRGFKTMGMNPYLILKPGYKLVLQTRPEHEEPEKAVISVLQDTKRIRLDGRWINTRVVEERAFEWDDGEWVLVEISRNWFAICNKTNDVYYFGEYSLDCSEGFDEDDICEGGAVPTGSWEAGKNGARPGIIMPGTFLLGAKYFQEMAEADEAVDRGEHVDMGIQLITPAGTFQDCVEVIDTNPAEEECGDDDSKIYCPEVGLVMDQDLELVRYGYFDDDNDDDDDHDYRNWWHYKLFYRWR